MKNATVNSEKTHGHNYIISWQLLSEQVALISHHHSLLFATT